MLERKVHTSSQAAETMAHTRLPCKAVTQPTERGSNLAIAIPPYLCVCYICPTYRKIRERRKRGAEECTHHRSYFAYIDRGDACHVLTSFPTPSPRLCVFVGDAWAVRVAPCAAITATVDSPLPCFPSSPFLLAYRVFREDSARSRGSRDSRRKRREEAAHAQFPSFAGLRYNFCVTLIRRD